MHPGTATRTIVLAIAMLFAQAVGSSEALGQDTKGNSGNEGPALLSQKVDNPSRGNTLVGVWEEIGPAEVDCQTRQPFGPIINALLTFNQGGTMYVEDTFPASGPYRSTGGGLWDRLSGRQYIYGNLHYEFDPDKTFVLTIKQRSTLTLSQDGNSFTENGTFTGIDPSGDVLFGGCFAATASRVVF